MQSVGTGGDWGRAEKMSSIRGMAVCCFAQRQEAGPWLLDAAGTGGVGGKWEIERGSVSHVNR